VAAGGTEFGDLTPWAELIDPFLDGMGRKRSGEVIRDYFSARDNGDDLDGALGFAVKEYARRHGDEFVTTRYAIHDSAGDRLWRHVQDIHYPGWPESFPSTAAAQAATLSTNYASGGSRLDSGTARSASRAAE